MAGFIIGAIVFGISIYRTEIILGIIGGICSLVACALGGLLLALPIAYCFIIAIAVRDNPNSKKYAPNLNPPEFRSRVTAENITEYCGQIMVIYFQKKLSAMGDTGIILATHEFLRKNKIETSDEFDFNEACKNIKKHLKLETVSKGRNNK